MIRERIREKPLVSVIVTVYNKQKYLRQCVESILAQTYELIEVILVDDGSTDDSGRICDGYAERDHRVEVLHKKNGGLISAWTAGVEIARGDYLMFVDSDDWIEQGMTEHLVAECSFGVTSPEQGYAQAEIICCNYVLEYTNGKQARMRHGAAPGEYTGSSLTGRIKQSILGNQVRTVSMSRCMKLISPGLIRQNLHYCDPAIRMGEDVTIMLPALLDSRRVVIPQDGFDYHYRYENASMVHQYDPGLTENLRKLSDIIRKVLREKFSVDPAQNLYLAPPEIEAMAARERLLLFQLQIKNEFRGAREGVEDRIRALCDAEMIPQTAKRYPLQIRGMADTLLYRIEQRPDRARIRLARLLYDIKNG